MISVASTILSWQLWMLHSRVSAEASFHGQNREFRAFVGKSLLRCAKEGADYAQRIKPVKLRLRSGVSGDVKKSA
jgi:hypothetical protein